MDTIDRVSSLEPETVYRYHCNLNSEEKLNRTFDAVVDPPADGRVATRGALRTVSLALGCACTDELGCEDGGWTILKLQGVRVVLDRNPAVSRGCGTDAVCPSSSGDSLSSSSDD